MRRKLYVFILLILFVANLYAVSFLAPGTDKTASSANGQTASAYFDFTPTLYNFHVFGFTNTVIDNPNMNFVSKPDILLSLADKADPHVYISDANSLYFSYSFTGQTLYEVKLKGADLKKSQVAKAQKDNFFTTETTVTFPSGYKPPKGNVSKVNKAGTYTSVTVLPAPKTGDTDNIRNIFGNYGSLEINIKATFVDGNRTPIADKKVEPERMLYVGDFTLIVKSI